MIRASSAPGSKPSHPDPGSAEPWGFSFSGARSDDQIVLISGDADFVPAAKLARREGIDFSLDPMWATISPDLHEHVDGMRTVCPKPVKRTEAVAAAA